MQPITDWSSLWRELVETRDRGKYPATDAVPPHDRWADRAHEFAKRVKTRWSRPDSSRDFICAQLDPSATVLDIGAGTGMWTTMMAKRTAHVTAIDPSPSMLSYLRQSLVEQDIANVSVIHGAWPDVAVEPHDFSLCSHAMYGCADFPGFINGMVASTRRTCFLLLRAPSLDGVMAEASQHIWGQPFDSPNFIIAYNALLQMGIFPNVLVEDTGPWEARTSPSLDDALLTVKQHFRLTASDAHDAFLTDLLRRRLTPHNGGYVWPHEVYSALIHWTVS
jgi:SAM-dependent methyltransferase